MDRAKLKEALNVFAQKCAEKGKQIDAICIEDAFPGDQSTSYIVEVKAPWADELDCSEAIDFLFDTLWETTTEEVRKKVFSIKVIDNMDRIHCWDTKKELNELLSS